MRKWLLVLALLAGSGLKVQAQMPDSTNAGLKAAVLQVTDSSAISMLVYDAEHNALVVYRRSSFQPAGVIPLLEGCPFVLIPTRPWFFGSSTVESGYHGLTCIQAYNKAVDTVNGTSPDKTGRTN